MSNLVDVSNISFAELQLLWRDAHAEPMEQAALAPKPEKPTIVITADTSNDDLNKFATALAHDLGLATGGRLFCYFVLDLQRQIDTLKKLVDTYQFANDGTTGMVQLLEARLAKLEAGTPPHLAKVEKREEAEIMHRLANQVNKRGAAERA